MYPPRVRLAAVALGFVCASWSLDKAPATTPVDAGRVTVTGNMTAVRFDHAAALLPNSQVLIVGGISSNGVMQSSAEVFDAATGRFSPTEKPRSPHGWGVTATVLRDGKVLVAGGSSGCDAPCYTASAELYDPLKRTFLPTGSMTVPRAGARSLLLPSGDVLMIGGEQNGSKATAELYQPSTGSFSPVGTTDLPDPSQLLLLKDGEVLLIGESGTDRYDPSTRRFKASGKMIIPRTKFGAALLPDGRVLVAGGQTGGARGQRVRSTQIYDPTTGRFTSGPELNVKRFKLAMAVVLLKNGRILVGGGAEQPEVYDPASGAFFPVAGSKLDGFCFSTATVLNDGKVLLAGGYAKPGGSGVNHAWIYQP